MELNEALLIVLTIVILFFGGQYLKKIFSPKANLLIPFIATILLTATFINSLVERFSYVMLFIIITFFLSSVYSLNKKYREYKKESTVDHHDSVS